MRVLAKRRYSTTVGAIMDWCLTSSLSSAREQKWNCRSKSSRSVAAASVNSLVLLSVLLQICCVSKTNANSLVNFQLNHVVSGSLQSVSSIQPSHNNQQHRDDVLSSNSLHSGIDANIKSGMFSLNIQELLLFTQMSNISV